jgi:hypothetical protein
MTMPATLKWIGLALLGIAIAAAVAIAAGNLVSRQIGLASEPIEAGKALAPKSDVRARPRSKPGQSPTAPAPDATTPVPPDESLPDLEEEGIEDD